MAESLLGLRDIQVRHGKQVALEISHLEIFPGEVVALLGPNGAGKTTLLQVMGFLQGPSRGEVCFQGRNAGRADRLALRRRIATVFQQPLLLNATVRENAALGLKLRRMKASKIDEQLRPWLERLGIAALANRSARTLSGGEAQRTCLARAFVLEPELLLLDEPFSALDPVSREALLCDFYRIVKDTRITTVFVTHDRQEAFALAERVGVLDRGRLLQIGSSEELFRRPNCTAVAEIVGFENRFAATVARSVGEYCELFTHGVRLRVKGQFPNGANVTVCIRAEDISLCPVECESGLNRPKGKVSALAPGAARYRVILDCGGVQLSGWLDRKVCQAMSVEPGVEMTAGFDAESVHVIADEPC